jgi:flagellar protein FliS
VSFAYQTETLASANGVELVVALYDGIIRFLNRARNAALEGNVRERRLAVKRALDIFLHLQSRLRHDDAPHVARSLEDFYASMLRLTLEASAANSSEGFEHVIGCVANVRNAWKVVATDRTAIRACEVRSHV